MTMTWTCCDLSLSIPSMPLIMGIVNVTPDSFSDGGLFFDSAAAIAQGLELIADGADILDIGGESTRPGATPVPMAEELRRVLPVIEGIRAQSRIPISIDTMKPAVARAALDAGAIIVNDVAGLRDPDLRAVCASSGCGIIINHMQGTPQTMQDNPSYDHVNNNINHYLHDRINDCINDGIERSRISLDPGIGFGKTFDQTIQQLAEFQDYQHHRRPVCLGVSRKGFLGQITGRPRQERDAASVAVALHAMTLSAVQIVRVHNVRMHRDAIATFTAIRHHQQS
jgi:dihydropteroate synthase